MIRHAKNSRSRMDSLLRFTIGLTFFLCGLLVWVFKLKGSRDDEDGLLPFSPLQVLLPAFAILLLRVEETVLPVSPE